MREKLNKFCPYSSMRARSFSPADNHRGLRRSHSENIEVRTCDLRESPWSTLSERKKNLARRKRGDYWRRLTVHGLGVREDIFSEPLFSFKCCYSISNACTYANMTDAFLRACLPSAYFELQRWPLVLLLSLREFPSRWKSFPSPLTSSTFCCSFN